MVETLGLRYGAGLPSVVTDEFEIPGVDIGQLGLVTSATSRRQTDLFEAVHGQWKDSRYAGSLGCSGEK